MKAWEFDMKIDAFDVLIWTVFIGLWLALVVEVAK